MFSILLSGSMTYLWGFVNALQMVVYTVLFNLETPENAF